MLREELRGAGIEIEIIVKKKSKVSLMRKRNKRTEIMAHIELAPLTEHILATIDRKSVV